MTQVTPITGRRHCLKPTTSVRCFYTNLHLRIKNFCAPEHLNVTVRLNEVKFKGKLYYVVKFDRPDPERGIPDKRDKLLCKNSVPNKNRPVSEASGYLASGYLRLHCIYRGNECDYKMLPSRDISFIFRPETYIRGCK